MSSYLLNHLQSKQTSYPLLFHVAMDILPAQASSMPCKQIFSSSKHTCTDSQNCLQLEIVEALQLLKFTYKQSHLNFTPDLITEKMDYNISRLAT